MGQLPPALAAHEFKKGGGTVKVGPKPGMAAHTPGKHYADPGYQKDGRKRYAIDTASEVRAALSYISQAANAAKYSAADLAKVKGAIYAAAARFGIQVYHHIVNDSISAMKAQESSLESTPTKTAAESALEKKISAASGSTYIGKR